MFCKNCGSEIKDDSKFCGVCGQPVAPVSQEVPQEETVVLNDNNQTPFAAPSFEPQPKKSKKVIKAIAIGGVALILVLAIVLNMDFIVGFMIKTFGSDKAYYKYVETNSLKDGANLISNCYGSIVDAFASVDEPYNVEGDMRLVVGDDAQDFLKDLTDEKIELDWLNELNLDFSSKYKNNVASFEVGLNSKKDRKLTGTVLADMKNSELYIAVPELNETYAKGEFPSEIEQVTEIIYESEIEKHLPKEKIVNKLLNRYIEIAMDNFEDVESSKETLNIDNISQKCTVLECEIDTDLMLDIAEDVLVEAQDDKEIKKILDDFQTYLEDQDLFESDDDLYEYFSDGLDDAIDSIDDAREYDNEGSLTLYTYVNSKHQIIGRKIEVEDEEIFYYATVQKGNKFAVEMVCADVELEGAGKMSTFGVVNGEFEVSANDTNIVTVRLEDFDAGKLIKKGYLRGKVIIEPGSEIIDSAIGSSEVSELLDNLSLEFEFDTTDKKAEIAMFICNEDSKLFGIELNEKLKGATKVKLPKDKDTIDADDEDDYEDWTSEFDEDDLMDIIDDLGIPEDALDGSMLGISDAFSAITSSGYDDYYVDEYDEDYSYDDDYDYDYDYEDDYDYSYDDDYDYSYDDDYDYDYDYDDDYDYSYDDDYYDDYSDDYYYDDYYDDYSY